MKRILLSSAMTLMGIVVFALPSIADERYFTYSYDADVLPKGQLEFEQWITSRLGREGGDFARWDFREELEYGLTDKLTTAVYLNFKDVYFSPDSTNPDGEEQNGMEFAGISSEWKYQIMNPFLDPFGLLIYGEVTLDGDAVELEEKIILQKNLGTNWITVFNAILEQEWEFEHGETVKESALEFTAGVAYKLNQQWSLGLEAKNSRTFEDSIDLDDQSTNAWFVGPNVHYGAPDWWVTLTVLPQVTRPDLELDDHERVEVRVLFGKLF